MRVLLFGATGMVGRGVLRECLQAADVEQVLAVGRTSTSQQHPKLREMIRPSLMDVGEVEAELRDFDACFFCLGVSSAGLTEARYTEVTYDWTLTVANILARLNPQMTFVYVSGAGTDSTESGRSMWARVKGKTENALMRLPFKGVYLFRPGVIQPLHGIQSKTGSYRWFYTLTAPLLPILRALFPAQILTTQTIGRAMLAVARHGAQRPVLESRDIYAIGSAAVQ
ncbi:MAG TPA: NAD(P)H-binding protein [Steroidobacteraceae bacterium]|nr:NAD(P)H-binding protein [Steroidobacteraceae bacterium]